MNKQAAAHTIAVNFPLSASFIADIMMTASEAHYEWFDIHFRKGDAMPPDESCSYARPLRLCVEHIDCDDTGNVIKTYTISHADIAEGIRRVLLNEMYKDGARITESHALVNDYARAGIFRAVIEQDAGDIDKDYADIIIQAATFGHIIYG